MKKKTMQCVLCGAECERRNNRQKYCPDCAENRVVYKNAKKIILPSKKAHSLGDINELARAAGMSYGQYVALNA